MYNVSSSVQFKQKLYSYRHRHIRQIDLYIGRKSNARLLSHVCALVRHIFFCRTETLFKLFMNNIIIQHRDIDRVSHKFHLL